MSHALGFRRIPRMLALAATLGAAGLRAAPPVAPSNLTVSTLGVNSFLVNWRDNSSDESFFGIRARLAGTTTWNNLDQVAAGAGSGSNMSYYQITVELPNSVIEFQIVAMKSGPPSEESYSNIFTAARTPTTATFNAPTALSATATDGVVTLTWADNANSEWGYRVENRQGTSGAFTDLGATNPNQNLNVTIPGHRPGTTYQYQVRGYKLVNNAPVYTAYTLPATVTTQPLAGPTNLVAVLANERDVSFTQTDRSQAESGFRIDYRLEGAADWHNIGVVGENTTTLSPLTDFLDPATAYEFRSTAFYGDPDSPELLSPSSNIAKVTTVFNAPTGLTASPASDTAIALSWTDPSAVEQAFAIYYRETGTGEYTQDGYANPDTGSYQVDGLKPGTLYDFEVRAAYQAARPAGQNRIITSNPATALATATRDALTAPFYIEAVMGRPFVHAITSTGHALLLTGAVNDLPPGLTYDDGTRTITGTPSQGGVWECGVQLSFNDGWTHNKSLTIRVLQAPQAATVLPDREVSPSSPTLISLAGAFSDADSETAVRVQTNLGVMHVLLFNAATPLTVSNFMAYVSSGEYDGTIIQRNVPGFVIQGGSFRPVATNAAAFATTHIRPPVLNEPGISNVRGTVSLAKQAGNPDSGTKQFFVSLANNGPILNNQNGGFTVFGRVPLADMAVPDAIAALPTGAYQVLLDGAPLDFDECPLTTRTNQMDNALCVVLQSMQGVPVLAYSVVSNSAPGVVSAQVNGGSLSLTPVGPGAATLVVRASDLDGLAVDQTFTVTVPNAFAFWAQAAGLPPGQDGPGDNADGGALNNFQEFAFMGSPGNAADDAAVRPVLDLAPGSGDARYLNAEFNLRKNAFLRYSILAGTSLQPSDLVVIWDNGVDGLAAPAVESAQDLGTHHRVRIRDTGQAPGASRRFLALEVREP